MNFAYLFLCAIIFICTNLVYETAAAAGKQTVRRNAGFAGRSLVVGWPLSVAIGPGVEGR